MLEIKDGNGVIIVQKYFGNPNTYMNLFESKQLAQRQEKAGFVEFILLKQLEQLERSENK